MFPESIVMDGRLGYRDNDKEEWQEISRSQSMKRFLKCNSENYHDGTKELLLDCELLPFFELGSVHHSEYLINVRFPSEDNEFLGELYDIWIYVIHQNGGFTFVWFSLKTLVFPIVTCALVWYIWRLLQLNRKPSVLERTLLAVGAAITLMNLPIDWLTLWLNMPFMMLYSDIRQGLFYSVLLCFWVIFAGEHMMDSVKRDDLKYYWKQLTAVGVACVCMFLFDFCERGIQLTNPFFSIWSTRAGANVAFGFIVLAGMAACVYFIYLMVTIVCVFKNICAKKHVIPSMSKARQKFYKNQIYRFSFLMTLTWLCAGMTVVFFIVGQVEEGHWKWGNEDVQYTSAVQTGVYGMWNLYVLTLLILYAPSNKTVCPIDLDENSLYIMPIHKFHKKETFSKSMAFS
ncbi:hypothetical protein HELRODRAFT_156872 [Helobdella robusta]|uniref:Protein wntless n=1 Tax=Helobdella robusta TaxID=6412 RepID=T1EM23_HELRO|nr:hypothetical protein HELRODRAFT_156872 [Helobdella robusta]ESO05240.1 hypothetical protein HELRODRAFT_156872 [Helobdella robusta]